MSLSGMSLSLMCDHPGAPGIPGRSSTSLDATMVPLHYRTIRHAIGVSGGVLVLLLSMIDRGAQGFKGLCHKQRSLAVAGAVAPWRAHRGSSVGRDFWILSTGAVRRAESASPTAIHVSGPASGEPLARRAPACTPGSRADSTPAPGSSGAPDRPRDSRGPLILLGFAH